MGLKQRMRSAGALGAGIGLVTTIGMFVGGAGVAHADPVQITANDSVNVRSAPGENSEVVGSFGAGQRVDSLGPEENGWLPVRFLGETAYISAQFASPVGGSDDGGSDGGNEDGGSDDGGSTGTPGTAWATTNLNIRSGPGTNHPTVGSLASGTQVETTGKTANGFSEFNHDGGTAWVATKYLSTEAPAPEPPAPEPGDPGNGGDDGSANDGDKITLPGLQPATAAILSDAQDQFPQIQTYYGVRPDAIPDHPSGRALDMMLPDYRNNNALGWEIAEYYKANASQFDVQYIIFDQQIWSVARNDEGWRPMENRGGDTANHKDHVHITVN